LVRDLLMKKVMIAIAVIISIISLAATSGSPIPLSLSQTEAKADSQNANPANNWVTLFEIPNEIRVEFSTGLYESEEPGGDFQLGEEVSLRLYFWWLRAGDIPKIANNTVIIISDAIGNVVLTKDLGPEGDGWTAGPGGGWGTEVPWEPEAVGSYTVGVLFEGLIYDVPNDFSNVMPIRIHRPGPFVGRVTKEDEVTAISDALIEALVDGVAKAKTTTDNEGFFNLELEKAGIYDIRVSAPGYTPTIQRGFSTEFESKSINFSLVPITISPNFNILWSTNARNCHDVVADSQGNIIIASENERGVTTISKLDSSGNILWNISRSFSGAWEIPEGLAIDSSDNILLLVAPNQIYQYDMWIVKLDPYGNEIWKKSFDSGETDQGTSLAVDSLDNIIIIGSVHGNLTSTLVKYTSGGDIIWSKTLQIYFENGEIAVDKNNNIILGGSTFSTSTGVDYYVAKLNTHGNLLWEKTFGSGTSKNDYGYGLSLDSNGNIIVIGDRFTIKLRPDGGKIWLKYFSGKDLMVDSKDNIFSIRDSFLEMFNPNGLFLGNTKLTEDLHILTLQLNNTVIVGGAQKLVKIGFGIGSGTQLNDTNPQPQPSSNSTQSSSSLRTTSAFLTLEPSACEANQTVKITIRVEPAPPTPSDNFQGIVLTIISPDGHTYKKGPYSTDLNGLQVEFFTPDQLGNYTLQFRYPGQVFRNENITYAASESPTVTLTVKPKAEKSFSSNPPSDRAPAPPPTSSPPTGTTLPYEAWSTLETIQTDQLPLIRVLAVIFSISVFSTALLVYFKKRNGSCNS